MKIDGKSDQLLSLIPYDAQHKLFLLLSLSPLYLVCHQPRVRVNAREFRTEYYIESIYAIYGIHNVELHEEIHNFSNEFKPSPSFALRVVLHNFSSVFRISFINFPKFSPTTHSCIINGTQPFFCYVSVSFNKYNSDLNIPGRFAKQADGN